MNDEPLFPEDFEVAIPTHAAEVGRWLRKKGLQEDLIEIFVGEYVINIFGAKMYVFYPLFTGVSGLIFISFTLPEKEYLYLFVIYRLFMVVSRGCRNLDRMQSANRSGPWT